MISTNVNRKYFKEKSGCKTSICAIKTTNKREKNRGEMVFPIVCPVKFNIKKVKSSISNV